MGKRAKQRSKSAALFDSDDEGSVSSSSTAMSEQTLASPDIDETNNGTKDLDDCLEALYEKRGSTREKALSTIVDSFRNKLQHQFVEKKCITLLHQCLSCIKRGSSKEINLACQAIGLLAITVGGDDSASREILEDSVPPFAQALKSGSDSLKISSILDCLAVITFICGTSPEETEKSMQIMWQVAHPKSGPNVAASKPAAAVVKAAISAWTFLLTTMNGWKLNSKESQETVSYFSTLLDKDDRSVRMAAGEAIAVIFEIGGLEKSCATEQNSSSEGHVHIQGLKTKILNQVGTLSAEAGGKGSANKKDLNTQRNLFRDVSDFLEDGYSPETSIKVAGGVLNISTWSQLIRMNFLKHFLAGGFAKHMQENELLHDVFGFAPGKHIAGSEHPMSSNEKRYFKSPNSAANKARTQLLNKNRMLSQGKNAGHYSVGADDE